MNVLLTDELKDFVRKKMRDGQFPTEEAVIEEALKRFRDQDEGRRSVPKLDDFVDHEFVEYCTGKPTRALPSMRSSRRPPRSKAPWLM